MTEQRQELLFYGAVLFLLVLVNVIVLVRP